MGLGENIEHNPKSLAKSDLGTSEVGEKVVSLISGTTCAGCGTRIDIEKICSECGTIHDEYGGLLSRQEEHMESDKYYWENIIDNQEKGKTLVGNCSILLDKKNKPKSEKGKLIVILEYRGAKYKVGIFPNRKEIIETPIRCYTSSKNYKMIYASDKVFSEIRISAKMLLEKPRRYNIAHLKVLK